MAEKLLLTRKLSQTDLISFAIAIDKNYQPAWFHKVIAQKLQEAYYSAIRGERRRVVIEMPPRHGKSDLASIKYPAWVLGQSPQIPIILTTYAQEFATDFGQATRDLMYSDNYQAIFKTRLRPDSEAKAKWMTEDKGGYTAVGIGGPITGRGFKLGIVDDYLKNREEADSPVTREMIWKWWRSTFLTREEGNGVIIVIATRWHDDDLIGRILKENPEEWEVLKFPAIAEEDEQYRLKGGALWPEKYPLDILENRRKNLGSFEWSALYQQNPVDEETREFHSRHWRYLDIQEVKKKRTRNFVTIDPAFSKRDESDNTGICLNYVDKDNFWHIKAWKVKLNSKGLIELLFKLNDSENIEVFGIEKGVFNLAIKPFLDDEMRIRNKFLNVVELDHKQTQKEIRIRGLIPRYESGSIFHITNETYDLEEELARFPKGKNDDVADATAYQLQIAAPPEENEDETLTIFSSNYT